MPSTRTAFLVFDPGFVQVVQSFSSVIHPHLICCFYFMDEVDSVLLNKQAFVYVYFLQHVESTSVKLSSHIHVICCHFMFLVF
jgi:hypothetical protein